MAAPVYSHLTYDVLPGRAHHHRSARHPDRRRPQRAADRTPAARRPRHSQCLRLLRFLDLSSTPTIDDLRDWYIDRFFSLRDGAFRESQILFPPLCRAHRRGGPRNRHPHLGDDQSRQSARKSSCRPASAPISSCARAPIMSSAACSCGNYSSPDARRMGLEADFGPRPDMGDHLGGGERAELRAVRQRHCPA